MQLTGANFWEMGSASDNGAKLWNAIKGYDWATGTAPAPLPGDDDEPEPTPTPAPSAKPDIVSRYLSALNSRNANNCAALYESKDSKLFAGNRRFKGRSEIKEFYAALFNKVMPKATFTFRTWSWKGNAYKINWKAAANGKAWSGSESINLNPANPKLILEHYSAIPTKKSIDAEDIVEEDPAHGPIPV